MVLRRRRLITTVQSLDARALAAQKRVDDIGDGLHMLNVKLSLAEWFDTKPVAYKLEPVDKINTDGLMYYGKDLLGSLTTLKAVLPPPAMAADTINSNYAKAVAAIQAGLNEVRIQRIVKFKLGSEDSHISIRISAERCVIVPDRQPQRSIYTMNAINGHREVILPHEILGYQVDRTTNNTLGSAHTVRTLYAIRDYLKERGCYPDE